LLEFLDGQAGRQRELCRGRLAAELGAEPALAAGNPVQLLDNVNGHADCP
jgi:hypothetical protein